MRFSHTARRFSGVIPSFGGAVFIEGGGGRISEKGLEVGLPEPEGDVIEVSAEDLDEIDGGAAVLVDDVGTAVTLTVLEGGAIFSFSDGRSSVRFGTFVGAGSGWRSNEKESDEDVKVNEADRCA
jgi:hypothetical protein